MLLYSVGVVVNYENEGFMGQVSSCYENNIISELQDFVLLDIGDLKSYVFSFAARSEDLRAIIQIQSSNMDLMIIGLHEVNHVVNHGRFYRLVLYIVMSECP
jgi:hypothetical protein